MERIPLMIALGGELAKGEFEKLKEWWTLNHWWYIPYLKLLRNQKGE